MDALSQHLAKLRKARGLSSRQAAHALGISQSSLRNYEAGVDPNGKRAVPKRETLLKMAKLYEYPAPALLAMAGLPVEEQHPEVPSPVELEAQEIAEIFRRLPGPHQRIFLGLARTYRNMVAATPEGGHHSKE